MLLGMAAGQAEAVRETVGGLLLYTPVVHPDEFDVAIAYLVRRLEEGASQDNFMSAVFELRRGQVALHREKRALPRLPGGSGRRRPAPEPHARTAVPATDGARPVDPVDSPTPRTPIRRWRATGVGQGDHQPGSPPPPLAST